MHLTDYVLTNETSLEINVGLSASFPDSWTNYFKRGHCIANKTLFSALCYGLHPLRISQSFPFVISRYFRNICFLYIKLQEVVHICLEPFCSTSAKQTVATVNFWKTFSITSCARGDTIYPRPLLPQWTPKRLARRRADATQQYFPKPNTFPR